MAKVDTEKYFFGQCTLAISNPMVYRGRRVYLARPKRWTQERLVVSGTWVCRWRHKWTSADLWTWRWISNNPQVSKSAQTEPRIPVATRPITGLILLSSACLSVGAIYSIVIGCQLSSGLDLPELRENEFPEVHASSQVSKSLMQGHNHEHLCLKH